MADRLNDRIQQFDATGKFVRAFGQDVIVNTGSPANSNGTGYEVCDTTTEPPNTPSDCKAGIVTDTGGALNEPGAVAIDQGDGSVYIIDGANQRVQKFSSEGAFIWASGKDVIVGGSTAHEACVVAPDCKAGATGALGGEVGAYDSNLIRGIAVAPATGSVYFTDPSNKRVQQLSPAGAFVRAFGWDVNSVEAGTEFEECTVAVECKIGVGGAGGIGQFGGSNIQFQHQAPNSIAVDSTGAIYTAESGSDTALRVQKFTPQAGPPALTPSVFAPAILSGANEASAPAAVAVDPLTDDVYVAKGFLAGTGAPPADANQLRVLQLDSAGTEVLDTSMANLKSEVPASAVKTVNGLAFDSERGLVYVSTSNNEIATLVEQRVYVFGDVAPPTIALANVTDIDSEGATVLGSVAPNGGLDTTYRVEYRFDGSGVWRPVGDSVNAGNGEAEVPIEHSVSGLPPNSDLWIRIVATKPFESARAESSEIQIHTPGTAPAVQTGQAWWNGSAELALTGTVNPKNANALYHFEYGPTAAYGSSVPVNLKGPAGDGGAGKQVVEQLYGLDTDTAFHYRLVASNEFGTSIGPDRIVTAHDESQVYELVSDGESNGLGISKLKAVSGDGQRVAVEAQTLGDPTALPSQWNGFIAQRGTRRWTVPPFGPDPSDGSGSTVQGVLPFSEDLTSMVFPQRTMIEAQGQEARYVLSRIDGTSEPASPHLVPYDYLPPLSNGQGNAFEFQAGSADLSTFVFKKKLGGAGITYLPDEPLVKPGYGSSSNLEVNLYQADGPGPSSTLSLANIGPSGNPISNVCGAWVGSFEMRVDIGVEQSYVGRSVRPVSRDGSVVYFSARPAAPTTGTCLITPFSNFLRIYKRIDNSNTVAVSESQCDRVTPDPPCVSANGNDIYQGASSDGEVIFFTSDRQLTDSDLDSPPLFSGCHGLPKAGCDLYLYDADPPVDGDPPVEQPSLVQVSAGNATTGHPTVGSGAEVQGVVESSTDGSRVYFVAKGQLTDEATQGSNNLFVYERSEQRPGGRLEFIATLPGGPSGDEAALWSEGTARQAYPLPFNGPGGEPGEGDGHLLFFGSIAQLTGEDGDSAKDLYRYDNEEDDLRCISCAGDGAIGVDLPLSQAGAGPSHLQGMRVASEGGSAATFITREAIVPEDENDVRDAYVWRDGELSLVSEGGRAKGALVPSLISADGAQVFFGTSAALHPADQNSGVDIYAASVGGGLSHLPPEESQCEDGQGCRGDAPAPLAATRPASERLLSDGNVQQEPADRCIDQARYAHVLNTRAKALRRKTRRASGAAAKRRGDARARRAGRVAKRGFLAAKHCQRTARGANADLGGNR